MTFPRKRYWIIIRLSALLLIFYCNACHTDVEPENANEVNATVVLGRGDTVKIRATGKGAVMGCSLLGGGSYVEGINGTNVKDANAAVTLSLIGGSYNCLSTTGTYIFLGMYSVNVKSTNTPIFSTSPGVPGSVTITEINENYMEGTFTAVCLCDTPECYGYDSIKVSGSFKGNIKH